MARKLKCQWCKVTDATKDEMVAERVGKQNKYYHKDCYQKYLEDKAFKEKERIELDELVEVIKRIYGVKTLPTSVYPFLQQIRNGEELMGRGRQKKRKEGYSYSLIAEAFDYCSDTIEYWLSQKSFNGFLQAFRYGLAIVVDKLPVVEKRRRQREMSQAMIEKHIEQVEASDLVFESNYKKKSSDVDISEFLDD